MAEGEWNVGYGTGQPRNRGIRGSVGGRVAALLWIGQLGQETGLTTTGHIPHSALTDQFT